MSDRKPSESNGSRQDSADEVGAIVGERYDGGVTNTVIGSTADTIIQLGSLHLKIARWPRPIPRELPPGAAAMFTGRAEELRSLTSLMLDSGRDRAEVAAITVIEGTPGVGKTAVALHWGDRVAEEFPDGQLYTDLRGFTPGVTPMAPDEALARALRSLGVPQEEVPATRGDLESLYRTLLRDRRVLIVLDNAAAPDQVRSLLPNSEHSRVLVTSRDSLSGLNVSHTVTRLQLDLLAPAEAVDLLRRLCRGQNVSAEDTQLIQLARLCAYLPLALRLAAASLRPGDLSSLAYLIEELTSDDRLSSLEVAGDPLLALRVAFDTSYASLGQQERLAFRRLSLNPGPDLSPDAVAELVAVTPRAGGEILERLHARHLLEARGQGRYSFHDLLRAFSAEQGLAVDGEQDLEASRQRLFGYYADSADMAGQLISPHSARLPRPTPTRARFPFRSDVPGEVIGWLDSEHENLTAAVVYAADHGMPEFSWNLADGLRGYFYITRHNVSWLATARAGLKAAEYAHNRRAEAAMLLSLGQAHSAAGDNLKAVDCLLRAAELSRDEGWGDGEATSAGLLGIVYRESGRLDEAAQMFESALKLFTERARPAGQIAAHVSLGTVRWETGSLSEAATGFRHAIDLAKSEGNREVQVTCLNNLALVLYEMGELDHALAYLDQAVEIDEKGELRRARAEALDTRALIHRDAGRLDQALSDSGAALHRARELGDRRIEASACNTSGMVNLSLRQPAAAARAHHDAFRLAWEAGYERPLVESLLGLAEVDLQVGRHREALVHAAQTLTRARASFFGILQAHALAALGRIYLRLGARDQAEARCLQAVALYRQLGSRSGEAAASETLGHIFAASSCYVEARRWWQSALSLCMELGDPGADRLRTTIHESYATQPRPP